ncbi:hypothetical protein [Luteimonas saliphila]|uniref:hypothetical protein n=1 Tax=Luteimonas saliphila TaxID=2804919 RepID=UPI00192DECD3|nr:hypothetical protein [Luteimonas saliphila]
MNASALAAVAVVALMASPLAMTQARAADSATLSFNPDGNVLAGSLYGIDAVDGYPGTLDKRASVELPAGRRTVWYSCPAGPRSKVTHDFSSGARYELVCKPGQLAEIRQVAEC